MYKKIKEVLFLINKIDINKIVVSTKVSFGKTQFKYFIDYKDDKKIRSLCRLLPKMCAFRAEEVLMKLNICLF